MSASHVFHVIQARNLSDVHDVQPIDLIDANFIYTSIERKEHLIIIPVSQLESSDASETVAVCENFGKSGKRSKY